MPLRPTPSGLAHSPGSRLRPSSVVEDKPAAGPKVNLRKKKELRRTFAGHKIDENKKQTIDLTARVSDGVYVRARVHDGQPGRRGWPRADEGRGTRSRRQNVGR